ncbi:MAG: cupin domain-containing protein [Marinilabiliales bacterium]
MINKRAQYYIDKFNLVRHPEGGWYNEILRFDNEQNQSISFSSIYYLLLNEEFSAFHRLNFKEIWNYHDGNTGIEIIMIDNEGVLNRIILGKDKYQFMIDENIWFAARLIKTINTFVLTSCVVIPAFDFNGFELGNKQKMIQLFPQHENIINELCR